MVIDTCDFIKPTVAYMHSVHVQQHTTILNYNKRPSAYISNGTGGHFNERRSARTRKFLALTGDAAPYRSLDNLFMRGVGLLFFWIWNTLVLTSRDYSAQNFTTLANNDK